MQKTHRMLMVESIKEVFDTSYLKRQGLLRQVSTSIGESLLVDTLLDSVSNLSNIQPITFSNFMSKFTVKLASEILYKKFLDKLDKPSIQYLELSIKRYNDQLNKSLSIITGRTFHTRHNFVTLALELDCTKLKHGKLKTELRVKRKKELIKSVKKLVKSVRPMCHNIFDTYNSKISMYKYVNITRKNKESALGIIGVAYNKPTINYMHKYPLDIMDIDIQVSLNNDTELIRSVKNTLKQPHTFDKEYNNAILSIVDTQLFTRLMSGTSLDESAIEAKTVEARRTIHEGCRFWSDVDYGSVYFSYIVDFRGRIGQVGGLSAVGHAVGKSMLRSGVKEPLGATGYDQILIALAGAMGHDKETFDVRLSWAKKNVGIFRAIGHLLLSDPTGAFETLLKHSADDIFMAAAISLELYRISIFSGKLTDYMCNLYIGYDATSSAVQLIGLLMGSKILTEYSNVRVDQHTEDKIHDSYMLVADGMDSSSYKIEDDNNQQSLCIWHSLTKSQKRKFAKPLLMTRLYGSKFLTHMRSCREQAVSQGILLSTDNRLMDFGLHIAKLFNYTFDNEERFTALREYEEYVKQIVSNYVKVNKHMSWFVYDANGGTQYINSIYNKFKGEAYTTYIGNTSRTVRTYNLNLISPISSSLVFEENVQIDKNKAIMSIAPNYIHSQDALVLHSIVNMLQIPLRLTHDCLACVPGKVVEMQRVINKVYVNLFGDNRLKQLKKLQQECLNETGVLVPLPVEYHDNGIISSEIENAKYTFS